VTRRAALLPLGQALVLLLLVAGPAAASNASAVAIPPTVGIVTPSGNIRCDAYVDGPAATMRCLVRGRSGPDLPRPAGLDGCDWMGGRWFTLGRSGPGMRFAPCDALIDPSPQRLGYGRAWRHGPFRCLSSRLALVCTNSDGHGLFLSRERQQVF
jgi:hypothetical protein